MSTLAGVLPVAPTVFTADEDLDLDGQRRVVDYLVDGGCDAVCVLANFSEQFSLDDEERRLVLRATVEQAAGRIPVVATTSHFSARIARERTLEAQAMGAEMVMLMPPFFGTSLAVDEDGVLAYFHQVCDGLEIGVMIQDAPLSCTPLSVGLLARLARDIPQVTHVKVEVPRAADKLRAVAAAAGEHLPGLFDGEEAVTLMPDLEAGAVGTMSSCVVPDELGRVVRDFRAGSRDEANARWERLLPLIHFENRQCGPRAAKVLLMEGGVIASDRSRAPMGPLHPETRAQLIALAKRADPLVLRWA